MVYVVVGGGVGGFWCGVVDCGCWLFVLGGVGVGG